MAMCYKCSSFFGLSIEYDGIHITIQKNQIQVRKMPDDMHKRKIDMADEIFVINVGGYSGDSTRSEIEYAQAMGKKVSYLEP